MDPRKPPPRGHFNEGLINRWITQRLPVKAKHGGQWIARPPTLLSGFGIAGIDQCHKELVWHNGYHYERQIRRLHLLFGGSLLGIRGGELLTAHHPSPSQRTQGHYCPGVSWGFPELT